MHRLDPLLLELDRAGASDLHLSPGRPPLLRLHGRLTPLALEALDAAGCSSLLGELLGEEGVEPPAGPGELLRSVSWQGRRYRVSVFRDATGLCGAIRALPAHPPRIEDLGLPSVIQQIAGLRRGLVILGGPAGAGATTTASAIVQAVGQARPCHVITIEEPIEIAARPEGSLLHQREVGRHTAGFAQGIHAALGEDPDVIVVGNLSGAPALEATLEAASRGHLVLAVLHATGAIDVLDRLQEVAPPARAGQLLARLAGCLQAIVVQVLLPTISGTERALAAEVLLGTTTVCGQLREGKITQLLATLQSSARLGMCTLNDSLLKLVATSRVAIEDAVQASPDRESLLRGLEAVRQRDQTPVRKV